VRDDDLGDATAFVLGLDLLHQPAPSLASGALGC
jgi:hypothetical protein